MRSRGAILGPIQEYFMGALTAYRPVSQARIAGALLLSTLMWSCGGNDTGHAPASRAKSTPAADRSPAGRLHLRPVGRLPAPLQLPSAVALPHGQALVLGGLSKIDVSTDGIFRIDSTGRARVVGRLPEALHDSAGAAIAGHAYLFGGGDTASSPAILRVGETGSTSNVGKLPVGASDVAAATIGSSAYIVGGYTGVTALDSILAFSPGRPVRRAASLPTPLRYAAVAAVGGDLLIAGGTSGTTAQRAIVRFRPATGEVKRIGRLPQPVTHAAAASLGGRFYVLGGRDSAPGSATAAIWSVDPATGKVTGAGRLPLAVSDPAAVTITNRVLVVGGRTAGGRVTDQILSAEPAS
jgi:hypothetical protein